MKGGSDDDVATTGAATDVVGSAAGEEPTLTATEELAAGAMVEVEAQSDMLSSVMFCPFRVVVLPAIVQAPELVGVAAALTVGAVCNTQQSDNYPCPIGTRKRTAAGLTHAPLTSVNPFLQVTVHTPFLHLTVPLPRFWTLG